MPLNWALESNTTRILPSFWGWYTSNIGRYQHSSSGFNTGAISAWSLSRFFAWIQWIVLSFLSFCLKSVSKQRRFRACSLLLERRGCGLRKGKGAIQWLSLSIYTSLSMISRNILSSINKAGLSSSGLLWKTLSPRLSVGLSRSVSRSLKAVVLCLGETNVSLPVMHLHRVQERKCGCLVTHLFCIRSLLSVCALPQDISHQQ